MANSNIVSLVATFFLRFVVGPLCDQFGSRNVYAGILLVGCLPIGMAPLVKDATGLYVCRFFIGVLGATFVPCQVWCTGFFDKNIVGTANAFAGGWGNAGGGLTYVIMPAIFDSFVHDEGMTQHKAWRVTFVIPLVCLLACGIAMLLTCQESPLGRWSEREERIRENMAAHGLQPPSDNGAIVDVPGTATDAPKSAAAHTPGDKLSDEEKGSSPGSAAASDRNVDVLMSGEGHNKEAPVSRTEAFETAAGETVVKPTPREALSVLLSLQTTFHVVTYACSFGGELALNAIVSSYFTHNFPHLDQTAAGHYGSIFGFLNVVTRPLGGIISDAAYRMTGRSVWAKKAWVTTCGVLTGVMLIIVGKVDPSEAGGAGLGLLVGLIALVAIFLEMGNGANFGLVPHVHPYANGIVSGATGAGGNLGGVIFAIVFRFVGGGTGYAQALWIIGILQLALNVAVAWIPPIPKGQVGGH